MPSYATTAVYALRKLLGSSNANDIDAGFAALADDVDTTLAGIGALPIGALADYAGASDPAGGKWLLLTATPRSLLRASYPTLFSLIGTTYGSVDGTHFNLPSAAGRTVIGAGAGSGLTSRTLGATGGEEQHLLTAAESGVNGSGVTRLSRGFAYKSIVPGDIRGAGVDADLASLGTGATTYDNPLTARTADSAHNVMQPWIAFNKIMRVL